MKNWIIVIALVLIIGIGIYFFQSHSQQNFSTYSNYSAQKLSTDTTTTEDMNTTNAENTSSNQAVQKERDSQKLSDKKASSTNKKLSKFSTRLPKDTKARYSNIKLACSALDGTVVKAGETFSLWDTLGCPTKQKGYRIAKAFNSNGSIRYSYGGGICQVSTTIYNALLKVDGIKIIERHEHSRDVVYIKDGKDAAVSYKSADLKFKNKLDYDIKLRAYVKNNRIVIKLEKA